MTTTPETLETLRELGRYIASALPSAVLSTEVKGGELSVRVHRSAITRMITCLRDDSNCQFTQLIDICGVDYPDKEERFEIVYHLLSMKQNHRVRVKLTANEASPVPSLSAVFSCANWFEREVWDMYGVFFSDHPDLRRILTDYGFDGHPLRKDFPLAGKPTLLPDTAFTQTAPLEGGPFVTLPGGKDSTAREPRVRTPEE